MGRAISLPRTGTPALLIVFLFIFIASLRLPPSGRRVVQTEGGEGWGRPRRRLFRIANAEEEGKSVGSNLQKPGS